MRLACIEFAANANREIPGPGETGSLTTYHCGIVETVIVGYDGDKPIFAEEIHDGLKGNCSGSTGTCSSFSCTKIAH